MPTAPKDETPAERAERLDHCFGLSPHQINADVSWAGGELGFLVGIASHDGIDQLLRWPRARQPGLGFIKIEANGHGHSVAKLTRPGLVALVLRLSRFMPCRIKRTTTNDAAIYNLIDER